MWRCVQPNRHASISLMSVGIETIEKLAALSRISLTAEEKEKMRGEFDSILEYVAAISRISSDIPEDARSIIASINITREDNEPHESGLYTESLLAAATRRQEAYIWVQKIL